MGCELLGESFDIHGGGADLQFPHHENEIAQSQGASGKPMAQVWMHNGFINIDNEKMSKSLGNFFTIKDALTQYRPEVIRTFILSAHYSNPVDYSPDSLEAANNGWGRIYNAVRETRRKMSHAPEGSDGHGFSARIDEARAHFIEAMNDDFNAPQAVATLQNFTREVNALLNGEASIGLETLSAINTFYNQYGGEVLGIIPSVEDSMGNNAERETGLIELLIEMRANARLQKNYAESDRIRNRLSALGVQLDDRPEGTIWRVE